MNNKFDGEKVKIINNKKNIKRNLVEKIWGPQLIKNIFFIKLMKNMWDYKKYNNVKMKLVEDMWGP